MVDLCLTAIVAIRWLPARLTLTGWQSARLVGAEGLGYRADRTLTALLANRPRERHRRAHLAAVSSNKELPPPPRGSGVRNAGP